MTVARAVLLAVSLASAAPALAQTVNPIDARVRASYDAAEAYQGPLDGGWTLVDAVGAPLYAFQLVDKVGGRAPLEGVYRDLRGAAVAGDVGFIDGLERGAGSLTVTLRPTGEAVVISLRNAKGGWAGEMHEGSARIAVRLQRHNLPSPPAGEGGREAAG